MQQSNPAAPILEANEEKNSNFILKGPIIVKRVRIFSGHNFGRLVWSNISCIIISTLIYTAWEAFTPIAASIGGNESTEVPVSTLLIGQASFSTEKISTPGKIINLGTPKIRRETTAGATSEKYSKETVSRERYRSGTEIIGMMHKRAGRLSQTHQDMPLWLHINAR